MVTLTDKVTQHKVRVGCMSYLHSCLGAISYRQYSPRPADSFFHHVHRLTIRSGCTDKVLAKRMLTYYRISECVCSSSCSPRLLAQAGVGTALDLPAWPSEVGKENGMACTPTFVLHARCMAAADMGDDWCRNGSYSDPGCSQLHSQWRNARFTNQPAHGANYKIQYTLLI